MEEFLSQYPKVLLTLSYLGSFVVLATLVVGITPSKKDDLKLQSLMGKPIFKKIYDFVAKFSVIQKK